MIKKRIMSLTIIVVAIVAVFSSPFLCKSSAVFAEETATNDDPYRVDAYQDVTDLDLFPGVKKIDFSTEPVRENISVDNMVDPRYVIKFHKSMPDEYFGATVSQITDTATGELIDGIKLGYDGVKGECGCIYHNMFQYRGRWIDVKTTYLDWNFVSKRYCFFAGGFAKYKWKSTSRVETKNEFFESGTENPVEVKGFLLYKDVDNHQGMYFNPKEVEDIWTNSGGTYLQYKIVPANVEYIQNLLCTYTLSDEVLSIQTSTIDDIDTEGESNYIPSEAAKTDFALTFTASVFHTSLIDNDLDGLNTLNVSGEKMVPSSFPETNSAEVTKVVSDCDESNVTTNTVRSWETWKYKLNAIVPTETEPGNFYDGFQMQDQIDQSLEVKGINVFRGDGENVTNLFEITNEENFVSANAKNLTDESFYGTEYFLEIEVEVRKTKDEMEKAGVLDESFATLLENRAIAQYEDGNGAVDIVSNKTETTVRFEMESDVVIKKKIKASDLYSDHGIATFIFNLEGQTASGNKRAYNEQVTITEEYANENTDDDGYVEKTVTFHNVPEGTYNCSEYDTLRFVLNRITNVTGGDVLGKTLQFTIDEDTPYCATFVNQKKNWNNYSDSNLIINSIGIGAN